MKLNKLTLCLTLPLMGIASGAMAETFSDVSNGSVDFTGSIVNTPCSITTANQALKVDLTAVKASTFTKKGDHSEARPLNILLSNCTVDPTTPYKATVTFSGPGADAGKTALSVNAGSDTSGKAVATGVGIEILDSNSTKLSLDTASTAVNITQSEMSLPFSARYVSVADTVTPGLANGHAEFTVNYN